MTDMDKKDKLLILVVSDTHENINNINLLVEIFEKKPKKPDYIFLLGDIVTIKQGDQDNEEKCEKYYEIINKILELLEKISPNVLYLPGNHDPKTLFENTNKKKLGLKSINLHLKKYDINENLLVIGIGGSITNLKSNEKEYHKYKVNINDIEWKGYPYIDDNENPNFEKCENLFEKDLNIIFNIIKENKDKQFILISHNGPFKSPSSNSFEKETCFYAGSIILDKYIYQNKNNILCALHGHTHKGRGICNLYNITICNPGSLRDGFYSEMNLILRNDKWIIKNISQNKI